MPGYASAMAVPITRGRAPATRASRLREGDFVVTRVAHHYSLGRVTADRQTQMPVETQTNRADALGRACLLAGADRRIFLLDHAGRSACIRYDCPDPLGGTRPVMAKADLRPPVKRRRWKPS
jgi:hypothetical protein